MAFAHCSMMPADFISIACPLSRSCPISRDLTHQHVATKEQNTGDYRKRNKAAAGGACRAMKLMIVNITNV